jgi:two-component system chemotaxis response regulator CheY
MGEKKKVLIVDDSDSVQTALKQILEENGYEVAGTAGNGLEAITKYRELKPDLVIMDIIMPQMNGLESLKLLQSVDPNVRVVMSSTMSDRKTVNYCIKAGAKDHILKPFEEPKVVEVVQTALS